MQATFGMPTSSDFSTDNRRVGLSRIVSFQVLNETSLAYLFLHAVFWMKQRSYRTWSLLARSAHAHLTKSLAMSWVSTIIVTRRRGWPKTVWWTAGTIRGVYWEESWQKSVLTLANCPAHGSVGTIRRLCSVKVEFLPLRTTSEVQLLYARIISWVEHMFQRRLLFQVFDNIDSSLTSVCNVDALTAMRWTCLE